MITKFVINESCILLLTNIYIIIDKSIMTDLYIIIETWNLVNCDCFVYKWNTNPKSNEYLLRFELKLVHDSEIKSNFELNFYKCDLII